MSNFTYALSQLKKFNNFIINNPRLRDKFILGEYNFLQIYQERIFSGIVDFKDNKGSEVKKLSQCFPFRVRFRQLLAILFSFFSYLFLIISRRKILIYFSDRLTCQTYKCDFRMENLYRLLSESKIKYFEIFQTTFRDDFIASLFGRRRPCIYLETVDILYKLLKHTGFLKSDNYLSTVMALNFDVFGDERNFFRRILIEYLNKISQTKFRISFLKFLFGKSAIKILIGSARDYFELVAAAKLNNIKTYGFKSGSLSKYNVGWLDCSNKMGKIIKPNKVFVESNYWKKELLRLGTYFNKDEIGIGGNLKIDPVIEKMPPQRQESEGITILMPFETLALKEEVSDYIKKFLTCPNVKVVFKLRADRNLSEQALEYGLKNIPDNLVLISDLKEINNFDIAAGTYSTFLYEMMGKGKPVVVLKTSLDHGEGMVINGLVDSLDINEPDFCSRLNQIKNLSADVLMERRRRLYEGAVPLALTLQKILNL